MERLWAPWRAKYILNSKDKGCFLCRHAREKKKDEKNLVVLRGKYCFAVLNLFPYNNGHLMVAPHRHVGDIEKLADNEMLEMMKTMTYAVSLLRKAFKPQAFNIGLNLGREAGAGLGSHLHIHVVPRWNGDTNFMPVCGATKVISISLEDTYEKLKKIVNK